MYNIVIVKVVINILMNNFFLAQSSYVTIENKIVHKKMVTLQY